MSRFATLGFLLAATVAPACQRPDDSPPPSPWALVELVERADRALVAEEWRTAADHYRVALERDAAPELRLRLGADLCRALVAQDQADAAIQVLVELVPLHPEALRASLLEDLGHDLLRPGPQCSPRVAELVIRIADETLPPAEAALFDRATLEQLLHDREAGPRDDALHKLGDVGGEPPARPTRAVPAEESGSRMRE